MDYQYEKRACLIFWQKSAIHMRFRSFGRKLYSIKIY